jgi:hypothetical protein
MNRGDRREDKTPRLLPALLVSTLLVLATTGCGAAGNAGGLLSTASAAATPTTQPSATATTAGVIPPGQRFMGDGDVDSQSDVSGNGGSPTRASYKFPDADDKATLAYGRRPSAATRRAIASVVERYYAAAAAKDGAAGCPLLLASLARSVSEDFTQGDGALYRGVRTCAAVLSFFFRHYRALIADAVTVADVRVEGDMAQVVLGSRTVPAAKTFLSRQNGSWKLVEQLDQPLP